MAVTVESMILKEGIIVQFFLISFGNNFSHKITKHYYIFSWSLINLYFYVLYGVFRFVPSKFEAIFSKHAHTNPNYLTYDELKEMIKANREPKNLTGR